MVYSLSFLRIFLLVAFLVSACGDPSRVPFEKFEEDFRAYVEAGQAVKKLGYEFNADGSLDSSGVRASLSTEKKRETLQTLLHTANTITSTYTADVIIVKNNEEISLQEGIKRLGIHISFSADDYLNFTSKLKNGVQTEIDSLL